MLYPTFDELLSLKHKASRLFAPSARKVKAVAAGDQASPFRGQGLEFEEVRHYAPGDDIRNIDWRVTARTGLPHTKVFREERERSIVVCIDVNVAMRFGTQGTFKSIQAARVAALLGWQAFSRNDRFGACLFGDVEKGVRFLAPQRSRKPLWGMFKELCKTDLNPQAPVITLEQGLAQMGHAIPTGALVYILSDFYTLDEAWEKQLRKLRKHCDVILIPIDDPADQYIPAVGPLSFSNRLKGKIFISDKDEKGRAAYAMYWQKTRESLRKLAGQLSIPLLPVATDADAASTLFFGLRHLQKRRQKQ